MKINLLSLPRILPVLCISGVLMLSACTSTTTVSTEPLTSSAATMVAATPRATVVSYRSPTCGCCKGWVAHMEAQGFVVEDMEALKEANQVPVDMASCHTAIVENYVIEGHVPASDVVKLLTEKPDVVGIAAPGMPIGSPGMESGNIREPYTVFTFDGSGNFQRFSEHNS